MAWIEQRQRADGARSVRQEATFGAGSDAQNNAWAEGFKQMVEAADSDRRSADFLNWPAKRCRLAMSHR